MYDSDIMHKDTLSSHDTETSKPIEKENDYFVHESAYVDEGAEVGKGSKIWHFSHVMDGAKIGEECNFGQNTCVHSGVIIGNRAKVQNNVSIYAYALIEDDVFLGPSCVLTNDKNPRCEVDRHALFEKTIIRRGATIGANATVVCGITIGRYAFIAAGATVIRDVPDYGLIMGCPGEQRGWMSRQGHVLKNPDKNGIMICPETGYKYKESSPGILKCLSLDENEPLPFKFAVGTKRYDEYKIPLIC